ncbi:MAG: MATE family efflux transporter [Thermodesulfobacteriota bacterium]
MEQNIPTAKSRKAGRYGKILSVSLPLVVSTATTMIMEFTDRIFLARYSLEAIAAAVPGGLTALLFIAFFLGVANYVTVFIAQYLGAGMNHRVGAALWQGIYFSLFAGVALAGISLVAEPLFRLGGHEPEVQRLEALYFQILCLGAGFNVLSTALSCFYMGQGHTRPVMAVFSLGMLFNIPFDYALINGIGPFPALGIAGAGLATVAAWVLMALLFVLLIFRSENDRRFGVIQNRRWEKDLFRRLMTFGIPGAVQFCMDLFAFTFFVFMVGRIGKAELAVTNIVLSINSLAFMPMMGFSLGTSTLVGQALGRNRENEAAAVARSTFHILYGYIFILAFIFLLFPEWPLSLFLSGDPETGSNPAILEMGIILLRFVAFYVLFDAHYMVYTGVLKGAGDTRFIMWSIGGLSILMMVLPVWIGVVFLNAGIYYVWGCVTLFILSLFAVSGLRYRAGKWKTMRVIETGNAGEHETGPLAGPVHR